MLCRPGVTESLSSFANGTGRSPSWTVRTFNFDSLERHTLGKVWYFRRDRSSTRGHLERSQSLSKAP